MVRVHYANYARRKRMRHHKAGADQNRDRDSDPNADPDLDSVGWTPRRSERYKQSARTSGGAEKWLDVRLFRSSTDAVMSAKQAGYQARRPPLRTPLSAPIYPQHR